MMGRTFTQRFLFIGHLKLQTGLHIGSGWTQGTPTDNPIVRTPDGKPFIPGSSFKGAFRSTVEKLATTVGLQSCLLEHANVNSDCLTPQQGAIGKAYQMLQGYKNQKINSSNEEGVKSLNAVKHPEWQGQVIGENKLLDLLDEHLCDCCKLFGSPYMASRINFSDLLPPEDDDLADKMIQIRDGVAIDRDSERAVDQLKYDYEVVAPAQTFPVRILVDDPSEADLALTCLGLSEFVNGMGYIGGKRSRGLGNCELTDLTIYSLDLSPNDTIERAKRLKRYLLGKTLEEKMQLESDSNNFLEQKIMSLPVFKEGNHA